MAMRLMRRERHESGNPILTFARLSRVSLTPSTHYQQSGMEPPPMHSKSGLARTSFCAALLLLLSIPAAAQIALGTAQNFGVLGGSTVTNTGASTVNGNVGVSPGRSDRKS